LVLQRKIEISIGLYFLCPAFHPDRDGGREPYFRTRLVSAVLFNRGEKETSITASWSDLGITGKQKVRDLWRQKDLGSFKGKFSSTVGRHGVVMVRIWDVNKVHR